VCEDELWFYYGQEITLSPALISGALQQYSTVQYSTVQYSTVQEITLSPALISGARPGGSQILADYNYRIYISDREVKLAVGVTTSQTGTGSMIKIYFKWKQESRLNNGRQRQKIS